ncbi:hypothetical protein BKA56DRAFT_236241 [Ilyonectria sp. MPI-CAGE-AT-0026]|nr:hypothetical protein BKA56DRAFT_236241 [Ilyonectria sp. MPI-CAGE-AT-0026]
MVFATVTIAALQPTYHPGRSESRFLAQRQIKVDSCITGGFCVGGACTDNTIGVDVHNCGAVGRDCQGGELCITGSCLPLNFSTSDPSPCGSTNLPCAPGQWCTQDGKCAPIGILADPRHCGPSSDKCDPGHLCVNGVCTRIDIGTDPNSCGNNKKKSPPGNWCSKGKCLSF